MRVKGRGSTAALGLDMGLMVTSVSLILREEEEEIIVARTADMTAMESGDFMVKVFSVKVESR